MLRNELPPLLGREAASAAWGQHSLQFSVGKPGLLSQVFGHRSEATRVALREGWMGQRHRPSPVVLRTDADRVLAEQVP